MGSDTLDKFKPALSLAQQRFASWNAGFYSPRREEEACHVFLDILQKTNSMHLLGLPEEEFFADAFSFASN